MSELPTCEFGCSCRYGTSDPDQRDCACDGPCSQADPQIWGCAGMPDANCGGDCPRCPHDCEKSPGDCPDFGCDAPAGTWWSVPGTTEVGENG